MCEGCGCHVLESIYQPLPAKVIRSAAVSQEYHNVTCAFDKDLKSVPGQYVMVSVSGFPEVVLDICVALDGDKNFDFFVHKKNILHDTITRCKLGDVLSLRGPFGKGFDLASLNNHDLCFIADEKGFASVRSVLMQVLRDKEKYGKVKLCFPENVMDNELLAMCKKRSQVQMQIIRNNDEKVKDYRTAVSKAENDQVKYIISLPSLSMQDIVSSDVFPKASFENTFVSLSHFIHCGVGTCGHCNTGALCVCTDGPFFRLSEINKNMGLISYI